MTLVDFHTTVTVAVGATTATVEISPTASARAWSIQQVSVEMPTAPIGATCRMTRDGVFITALIPTGDVAGSGPPVTLRGFQKLLITWSGVAAGMTGSVYVIYDDGR